MGRKYVGLQNMERGVIYPIWNYEGPDSKQPISRKSQVLTGFEYCLRWLRTKVMSFSGRSTAAVTASQDFSFVVFTVTSSALFVMYYRAKDEITLNSFRSMSKTIIY